MRLQTLMPACRAALPPYFPPPPCSLDIPFEKLYGVRGRLVAYHDDAVQSSSSPPPPPQQNSCAMDVDLNDTEAGDAPLHSTAPMEVVGGIDAMGKRHIIMQQDGMPPEQSLLHNEASHQSMDMQLDEVPATSIATHDDSRVTLSGEATTVSAVDGSFPANSAHSAVGREGETVPVGIGTDSTDPKAWLNASPLKAEEVPGAMSASAGGGSEKKSAAHGADDKVDLEALLPYLQHTQMTGPQLIFPEDWPEDSVYVCAEDDRPVDVARKFRVNLERLVRMNRK